MAWGDTQLSQDAADDGLTLHDKNGTYKARAMPAFVATILPHVDGAACCTQDALQSGVKSLRPRTRGLQAWGDDPVEPDAGVLDRRSGDLAVPHRGPVDGRVVPEQGDDLPGRERVSPLRGRHWGRRRPRRAPPPIAKHLPAAPEWGSQGDT